MPFENYDYIIVGAGSAGCVLANRLSENPRRKVLLIEAGKRRHPLSPIPVSFAQLIDNPAANWCYGSEPDPAMGNRKIPIPRGRLLGGSSSINGLVYVRGQPLDYNTWAQLGNRGWSFDDVLPIFKRIEHYESGADEWRCQGGPLHVSEVPDRNPLYDAMFAAAEEVGLPRNRDYNGADQTGMGKTQTTIRNGRRVSTAVSHLRPVQSRRNLKIVSEALVSSLVLEGKRCVGVRYLKFDQSIEARANAEIILSAGSINSPQLLELSGIGRPDVLSACGLRVNHALHGVGEHLRDHITPRMAWKITRPGVCFNDRARGIGLLGEIVRYAFTGQGFLSLPSAPLLGFIKTRPGLESPDAQLHVVPYAYTIAKKRALLDEPGMTISVYQLRPESLGTVHIRNADPREHPAIRCNFLSDALDRRTLVDAFRYTRRLVDASAMDHLRGAEFKPGSAVQSDDEILGWIADTAETAYHPVGTCRMGSGENAVVDAELRVHGIENLRIADGSIMPTLVSGNTNAACIMIGEKAADMILGSTPK